jgi:hypothetical protein
VFAVSATIRGESLVTRRAALRAVENKWLRLLRGQRRGGNEGAARLRFYFERATKLVDFFVDQEAIAALGQALEIEWTEADAFQLFDGMLFSEEHAAKNIFFGILQRNFVPKIFGVAAGGIGLADRANGGGRIAAQALEFFHHQAAFDLYVIHLLEVGPVLQHFGGKIAVIGEKNQATGVVVEAADGIYALRETLQTISERFAAFGIG